MTNKEWLDYLAHNAPDELAAWFDAEHVDTEERALDGDTAALEAEYGKGGMVGGSFCDTLEQGEVVMPLESWRDHLDTESESEDSRELLDADVRKWCGEYAYQADMVWTWLDRQAAITEEKTRYKWVTASAEEIAAWRSKAEKLKEQVYELTAERDKLQEQLRIGWECECKLQDEREEYRKLFGMALDWAHEITMLESSVDEGMA